MLAWIIALAGMGGLMRFGLMTYEAAVTVPRDLNTDDTLMTGVIGMVPSALALGWGVAQLLP